MLAPQAVDIHSWNPSNYYFAMFHICRTIRRHFSLRRVNLYIGQRKYKQMFTTQGRKEWPTYLPSEWIRARSLNSYSAFCKIVVKTEHFKVMSCFCYCWRCMSKHTKRQVNAAATMAKEKEYLQDVAWSSLPNLIRQFRRWNIRSFIY